MKGFSSKRIALKVDVLYRTEKYTVSRRARASFSSELLHAGVVKGLIPRYFLDSQSLVVLAYSYTDSSDLMSQGSAWTTCSC